MRVSYASAWVRQKRTDRTVCVSHCSRHHAENAVPDRVRSLRPAGAGDGGGREDGRVPFAQRHRTAVVPAERGSRRRRRRRSVHVFRQRGHKRPGEDVDGCADFERGRRANRQQRGSDRRRDVDEGRGDRFRRGGQERTAEDPAGRPGADRRPRVRGENRLLRIPARRHDRFLQEFVRGQKDQHEQVRTQ